MLKRLLLGLLKGLLIGGLIGAGMHFGLGWVAIGSVVFGYLLAMAAGGSAGLLAGKPPWKQAAWIEGVLKTVAGVGFGALAFWAASKWLAFGVPGVIPGLEGGTPWTHATLLMPPVVAALFGSLVELDNTDSDDATPRTKKGPKVRVEKSDVVEPAELVEPAQSPASKVKSR